MQRFAYFVAEKQLFVSFLQRSSSMVLC